MNENESIDGIITKFTKITNDLASLSDAIDNDQKVRKVIRALPQSWKVKTIILKEPNDKEKMQVIGHISNLKTHEMERKTRKEKVPLKKKSLTSKSTPTISDDDEEEDDLKIFPS